MGLTKTTVGVTNISDLSSTPNATEGLTAAQLQAKFDKTGADLKTYINDTLTAELDTYHGSVTQTELSYVHGVTSAIQTQLDNKKLYSKIITATRDGTAASGDVSYTGVGFVPTSIHCLMSIDGTLFQSDGFSDSLKSSQCKLQSAANVYYNSAQLVNYSNRSTFDQYGVVKSYDADGFTLTWTKSGTPTAGTLSLIFICYK